MKSKPSFNFPPVFVSADGTIMQRVNPYSQYYHNIFKPSSRYLIQFTGKSLIAGKNYSKFKTELAYERNPEFFL